MTDVAEADKLSLASSLSHLIHRHFILILLGSYAVAALFPALGLMVRDFSIAEVTVFNETVKVSAPMLMLAYLLFNAGFGIKTREMAGLNKKPSMLLMGLAANIAVPLLVIAGLSALAANWHNNDELQSILVGLALVASMPIAGSSTAWAQNANGNMAISVGLVLLSTVLSPVLTPFGLQAVSLVTSGDYSEDLVELSQTGTRAFLLLSVIIPVVTGMVVRHLLTDERAVKLRPFLKLTNSAILVVLIYSNAAISLPKAFLHPDWDFLALVAAVTGGLCFLMFTAGWLVSRMARCNIEEKVSMLFALGMNNNGTGLVLAGMALSDHPNVLLPIIFYNLIQHLAAGSVDFAISRKIQN